MTTSASIGIAVCNGLDEVGTLLRNADAAMYRAKMQGKARYVVFKAELHARYRLLATCPRIVRHDRISRYANWNHRTPQRG